MRVYLKQLKEIKEQAIHQVETQTAQINQLLSTFNEDDINTRCIGVFKKKPEEILVNGFNTTLLNVLAGEGTIYRKTGKSKNELLLLQDKCEELVTLIANLYESITGNTAYEYFTASAILSKLHSLGILQDVAAQIDASNRQLGRLPISDINQLIFQIIDGQDAPFIYERIGQYFRHFMIDEFQDTSALQWENFAPLIHETEDNHRDNLIVGDVKQSIYRFRNSDWHMLNNVEGEFHNTKVPKMEDNWRTAPIVIQENEKLLQLYSQYIADQLDQASGDPQISQDIRKIYSYDAMHQVAQKSYHGYFHMQFFEDKTYKEDSLKALDQLLQSLQQEGVDLKRVTLLVRRGTEAAELARFLVERNYSVQSAEGLRVGGHPAIKTIVNLLKDDWQDQQSVTRSAIEQFYGILTDQHIQLISQAQSLPLYERIQAIIDILNLPLMEGAAPYITAFQDIIYQFANKRVADTKAFLDYWKRKEDKITIPAAKSTNTIQIMTIHSSKGLEFDIVIIPRLSWPLFKFHDDDILWCEPQTAPFNTLPLVPVHPEEALTLSHFKQEYIQEMKAQYMDNLNLTYVALTRPRYRLYAFGQKYSTKKDGTATIKNIGHLFSYLYDMNGDLNEQLIYAKTHDINAELAPLPPLKQQDNHNAIAQYISVPINQRLVLRSRSEDDFAEDTTLSTINLGILMHLWLSFIHTWEDAEPSLKRLILGGQITQSQACELRLQLQQLQLLIQQHNHNDWFSGEYQIMAERDIFTPSGNMQRPDRVMIRGKHAIVIDYKFGQQQKRSYVEQVRDYMLLLNAMGYTTEGYIIYNALQTITTIS
jgi:ATP-dependent exoDNAse (exonuclease V) beta subunit